MEEKIEFSEKETIACELLYRYCLSLQKISFTGKTEKYKDDIFTSYFNNFMFECKKKLLLSQYFNKSVALFPEIYPDINMSYVNYLYKEMIKEENIFIDKVVNENYINFLRSCKFR